MIFKSSRYLLSKCCWFLVFFLNIADSRKSSLKYLVEFRGTHPLFRINMEFQNIIQQVRDINFAKDISCQSSSDHSIVYESVMSDPLSDVPLCIFTNFPSDEFAREVAKRSCLIRSIVQVYGDGKSAEECSQASSVNMPNILAQERVDNLTSEESNKSSTWRVTFRRHGREGKSGLDPAGKRQRLAIFTPALKLLGGSVDLLTPSRDLLYLEDWTGFVESERRNTDISTVPSIDNEGNEKDDDRSHSNKDKSILNELTIFSPTRCLFGRIIAEGPSIFNMFELSSRPFIGTTSMDPLSSHLAAVAANIKANDLVLDPYCGTGSLLIACAHMGAEVIGSDFDSYNFGLDFPDAPTDEANLPSTDTTTAATNPIIVKYGNRAFKRVKGRDQSNKSVFDNFKHYNMDDRCVAMINADSLCWIPLDEEMHKSDVGPEHYYFPVSSQGVVELNQVSTSSPTHLVVAGLHTARVVSYPDNVSRSLKLRDVFEIPDDLCPELSPSGLPIHTLLRSQLKLTRKLDAIVSDPPFGIREKAFGHARINSVTSMGDSRRSVATLLLIARHRLKQGGRLVFWLPTPPETDLEALTHMLRDIEKLTHCEIENDLRFVSATPQHLHSKLSRWLCVYEKL